MTEPLNAAPAAADTPGLPEKQRRLIELDDAIAKIRTQIATADLTRQTQGKPIDPVWFNRARTAPPLPRTG
jgi:hypothetical protein